MASRHLQVLPVLRSTAAKLRRHASGKENAEISSFQTTKRNRTSKSEKKGIIDENCLSLCETPKSEKNRIPKSVACPAAPRKPIRRIGVVSCKRKLMPELEFFEGDRRKEVDEFFRSSFERISTANAKKNVAAAAADAVAVAAESPTSSSSSSPAWLATD